MRGKWSRAHLTWAWFLRLAAVAGIVNEAVFSRAEHPTLIALYAIMLGLPNAVMADVMLRRMPREKEPDAERVEIGVNPPSHLGS